MLLVHQSQLLKSMPKPHLGSELEHDCFSSQKNFCMQSDILFQLELYTPIELRFSSNMLIVVKI